MPDTLDKKGPKGWSHGWVWNGPGPMPSGAPPQARDASGAGAGKPASGGHGAAHGPAREPAHGQDKPAVGKPKKPAAPAKPTAGKKPASTAGGGQAQSREHAHNLRIRAKGLREQARQLDHEASDLAAGLRRAAGHAKITNRKTPAKKPANTPAKKPSKTPAKPTTATRVTNLRMRAAALVVQAIGLETQAKQILAKKTADGPDLTKSFSPSDPSRRHVAKAITDELTYLSFPITKFSKNDEGDLIVIGKATDGSVDSDEQIVDPKWSAKALGAWMETGGNVRVQHQAMRDPAGKGIGVEIDRDGDGGHWVKTLVVEPVAKRLVEKGVLTAYSVGIARPVITRDPTGKARGGIVTGGSLAEISLVDRPANKNCGLMIGKAANGAGGELEMVGELFGDPDFLAKASTEAELLTKGSATAEVVKDDTVAQSDDGQDGDTGNGGQASAQAADADTDDDDGQDGDDAVSKAVDPATAAAYKAERAAWLAGEPSVKGIAGGTEYLAKVGEWKRWSDAGDAEGLTGTADAAGRWLEKRTFTAAERDRAADSGAAMDDGSFPIKTKSDLQNAIHLAGNAKDPDAARAHIKRRAAALGAESLIPDTWKAVSLDDLVKAIETGFVGHQVSHDMLGFDPIEAAKAAASDGTVGDSGANFGGGSKDCATCKGDGKIMGGQRDCPDCSGKGKVPMSGKGDATTDSAEVAEPAAVKGSKDCKGCGKSYDADTSMANCENCGKKLPSAMSGRKAARRAERAAAVEALAATVIKAVESGVLSQEVADEVIAVAAAEVTTKAKQRVLPGTSAGASVHREPDGSAVEDLEGDAGMPTDKDPAHSTAPGDRVGQVMAGRKSDDPAPYTVGRMHDVMCAAFAPGSALAEYPALKSVADAVDTEWFKSVASDALEAGKANKAARYAGLLAEAQSLKGADPAAVADGFAHLHKSFTDMYPNEHIAPADPRKPGSFMRPYLAAGHAAENADRNGGANIPPSSHTPEPESFKRPLITDGHEADSPANKAGDNMPTMSGASRTYYSNAQREAARQALANLHDHIAQTFPDLCDMSSSRSVMPPDNGATNVPTIAKPVATGGVPGVGKTTDLAAPTAAAGSDLQRVIQQSLDRYAARHGQAPMTRKALRKAAGAMGLDVVTKTAAVAETTGVQYQGGQSAPIVGLSVDEMKTLLTEQIAPLTERYEAQIAEVRKQLDDIGSQPDPAMAPVRGALAHAPLDKAVPVERRNLVDEAAEQSRKKAADEDSQYREYVELLAKSSDPGVRERAMTVLNKITA